ncbi:hypothetical protein ABU614_12870 [Lysobacter firmicutimachus]|uniref:Uncharacterized protein n=1 Tax=Lysobacter firmicutimachus TaxID=1792846 RepID=A0AAU8MNS7_9GAMM
MALDAIGDVLGGALRLLGRLLFEGVVELLLHGTGWVLLKPFYGKKEPGEALCMLVGLAAWTAFAAAAFFAYRYLHPPG